jgi:hypothetical protein
VQGFESSPSLLHRSRRVCRASGLAELRDPSGHAAAASSIRSRIGIAFSINVVVVIVILGSAIRAGA